MTPLSSGVQPRARSKCGGSAWPGGRALRLQRRAALTHTAHAAVARKRSPAHLRVMMSETSPHPRPRQEREARLAPSVSSSAKCTTSLTSPPSPRDNVRNRGSTCGRSGVQRLYTPLVPSAQREAATGLPYRRPGPRRCTPSRRRARSARRRWQPAAAPPGTQARSALGAQRRAPSAERVARGGDQARRRRRARSAHTTGAERVARDGASWHAGAARASSRSSNAGRLLPASATLTSFVGGIKTMSPAPGGPLFSRFRSPRSLFTPLKRRPPFPSSGTGTKKAPTSLDHAA